MKRHIYPHSNARARSDTSYVTTSNQSRPIWRVVNGKEEKNKYPRIIHIVYAECGLQLYIECFLSANNRGRVGCTHCMPFRNISFSHFAVSFPGLVPHVLLMGSSLILLARSGGGRVATYVSHKRPSLGHMGKPSQRECIHARALISHRSIAAHLQNKVTAESVRRMNNVEHCFCFSCVINT